MTGDHRGGRVDENSKGLARKLFLGGLISVGGLTAMSGCGPMMTAGGIMQNNAALTAFGQGVTQLEAANRSRSQLNVYTGNSGDRVVIDGQEYVRSGAVSQPVTAEFDLDRNNWIHGDGKDFIRARVNVYNGAGKRFYSCIIFADDEGREIRARPGMKSMADGTYYIKGPSFVPNTNSDVVSLTTPVDSGEIGSIRGDNEYLDIKYLLVDSESNVIAKSKTAGVLSWKR